MAALSTICLTGTALADEPAEAPETCPDQPVEQPFQSFGDMRDYVLVPGGSFEDPSLSGWTLEGGAAVVAGNEPFFLHGAEDTSSLSLPAGASATSPAMCVDLHWSPLRFVALQEEARNARLTVEVLYPGTGDGRDDHVRANAEDGWNPTDDIRLRPRAGGREAGARQVVLRFTSNDRGSWRIDDLYVDPRMK